MTAPCGSNCPAGRRQFLSRVRSFCLRKRPAAPLGRDPRNPRCGFFLSENLNMRCRAFMPLQRSRRIWRRATGSSSPGEDKKFGKWLFRFASIATLEIPQNGQGLFGKAWRKQAEFWKNLEKKLGGFRGAAEASAVARSGKGNAARGPRSIAGLPASSYPIRWPVREFLLGAAA